MIPDDTMTTEKWCSSADKIGDGWVPARIPTVKGALDDEGALGWTKGEFGVFEGNAKTEVGYLELSSLTHLKSGKRIALFSSPEAAALAAELAERVGDWAAIDEAGLVNQEWQDRARKMYALWQSAGFIYGPITSGGKGVWCATEPIERVNQ